MGFFKHMFEEYNTEGTEETEEKKKETRGFFEGGDDITIEDMIIMDILDGDD